VQLQRRALVSEAEFLALPESLDKVELLDGEVIVSPSPQLWHQEVLQRIVFALRQWRQGISVPVTICQAPQDVRFGHNRILQPDAFVLLEEIPFSHEGPIDRVPELCIEVVSSDRVYDRVTKRLVYAAAGVQEYWVVEHAGIVERWHGPGLVESEELRQHLATSLLPGFSMDIGALFSQIA
jgi:Uma2 family endonuclease